MAEEAESMAQHLVQDAGQKAVAFLLEQISAGVVVLPDTISLRRISESILASPQVVGMAFEPHIKQPLAAAGIHAQKGGKPVGIILRKLAR